MNTREEIVEFAISKLNSLGFVNVNKSNLLKDEVYLYHFRKLMDTIKGKNDEVDKLINTILKTINV